MGVVVLGAERSKGPQQPHPRGVGPQIDAARLDRQRGQWAFQIGVGGVGMQGQPNRPQRVLGADAACQTHVAAEGQQRRGGNGAGQCDERQEL